MHWEKFADWFFGVYFCFVFYSNDSEFIFFRGLFNIYRRSVGLIGFFEGLSIDFFQHFELRVWRTDIYCSNLQLAIETFKVDIKKYRATGLLECLLFSVSISSIFVLFMFSFQCAFVATSSLVFVFLLHRLLNIDNLFIMSPATWILVITTLYSW